MKAKQSKNQHYLTSVLFFVLFSFLLSGFTSEANAQISVSGKVSDASGEPLMGATITLKGSETTGTQTDFDGNYSITVPNSDAVLVFRYLGYASQEIVVGNRTIIDVTMQEDASSLDEIIVVGYGTQKKSDITGAVAKVKAEDLNKVAVVNPTDALQGRAAGVTVVKSSGAPGSGVDIKIRGTGTFGGNAPLYIIDGVQATSYYLDPNNIESIEVLKDVSSAAIYGTRAANGVVLITTKKGKKGDPKVDVHSYISFNSARETMDMLNADQYVQVHRQMFENAGLSLPGYVSTPPNVNTNWVGEVFRDAVMQNHSINISGASDIFNYSISGNLADEEGIVIGSEFTKKTLGANLGLTKNKFTVNTNITYSETYREDYKLSLRETYQISPLIPIYDDTKEFGFGYADALNLPDHRNPIGEDHFENGWNKLRYFRGDFKIGYEIIEGLKANVNYSVSNQQSISYFFNGRHKIRATGVDEARDWGFISESNSEFKRIQQEYLLNYKKEIGEHSLDVLAGYSRIFEPNRYSYADVYGYKIDSNGDQVAATLLDPSFNTLDAFADGTKSNSGSNREYALASVFGRINYAFQNKYLFQASFRRDGSSKFGKDKRYGTFPAFALGWKISEESFMEDQDIFNFLKLRASWGQSGNDNTLGYFDYASNITSGSSRWNGGYVFGETPSSYQGSIAQELENRDLQWETNTSLNIGLDFASLNNALTGSINYYNSKTSDLLILRELPGSAGTGNPIVNVGEFQNSGLELELSYRGNISEDFTYNLAGTFSTTKNEVTKLSDDSQEIFGVGLKFGDDHFVNRTVVGREVGAYHLYQADGIFQSQAEIDAHEAQPGAQPGDVRFVDINGDGQIDAANDKVYSGTAIPKYEYSLNLGLDYKDFDFTMFLQGVGGNKIYNGNSFELEGMDAPRNFTTNTLNAWTPSNTNTSVPRAVHGDPNGNNRASTRFLENGAYLRIKTIQLGYSLPNELTEKFNIDNLRLYVSGQNLFTITDYSGLDPEVGGSVTSNGVDRTLYPKYKSFIMGVQLKF